MFYQQKARNLKIFTAKTGTKGKRFLFRTALAVFLPIVLTACQTHNLGNDWPKELPPSKVFVQAYLESRGLESATDSELSYHLTWVKRFYQGSRLYPRGWLYASGRFKDSINDPISRKKAKGQIYDLGIRIANEWAQDNDVRKINNSCIATWADAMRTAAERSKQLEFLDQVEADVERLISGEIQTRDIEYSRYFEEETYDDF